MRNLLLSHLPASALNALVAKSLDPDVASDSAWDELMTAIEFRVPEIAKDISHLQHASSKSGYDNDDDTPSELMNERLRVFGAIFSMSGDKEKVAAKRLSESFASETWMQWDRLALELIPRLAKEQKRANEALTLFLRHWLVREYVKSLESNEGDKPLKTCLRLGVLDQLMVGEVEEHVLRQHARWKRKPWDPKVVAAVEALVIQREVESAKASGGLSLEISNGAQKTPKRL